MTDDAAAHKKAVSTATTPRGNRKLSISSLFMVHSRVDPKVDGLPWSMRSVDSYGRVPEPFGTSPTLLRIRPDGDYSSP